MIPSSLQKTKNMRLQNPVWTKLMMRLHRTAIHLTSLSLSPLRQMIFKQGEGMWSETKMMLTKTKRTKTKTKRKEARTKKKHKEKEVRIQNKIKTNAHHRLSTSTSREAEARPTTTSTTCPANVFAHWA
jgi:hypothetical protein